jgi:hypothetical protein
MNPLPGSSIRPQLRFSVPLLIHSLEEFTGCTEYSVTDAPIYLLWVPTDRTVRMEAQRNDSLDLQADKHCSPSVRGA